MLNQCQNIPTVWSLFIALFTPGSQANHPSSIFRWLLPQVLPPPFTYSLPILITASRVDPGDTAWSRLCSRPCIDLLTRGNINNFCLWALWPLRPAPPLHHSHQSHTSFPCFFIVCSGCLFLLFPMPQQPWLTFSWFCLSLLLISTMSTILTTLQPAPSLSLLLLDCSSVSSYCPWFPPQHYVSLLFRIWVLHCQGTFLFHSMVNQNHLEQWHGCLGIHFLLFRYPT